MRLKKLLRMERGWTDFWISGGMTVRLPIVCFGHGLFLLLLPHVLMAEVLLTKTEGWMEIVDIFKPVLSHCYEEAATLRLVLQLAGPSFCCSITVHNLGC